MFLRLHFGRSPDFRFLHLPVFTVVYRRNLVCDLQLRGQFGIFAQFPFHSKLMETKIFAKITFLIYWQKKYPLSIFLIKQWFVALHTKNNFRSFFQLSLLAFFGFGGGFCRRRIQKRAQTCRSIWARKIKPQKINSFIKLRFYWKINNNFQPELFKMY